MADFTFDDLSQINRPFPGGVKILADDGGANYKFVSLADVIAEAVSQSGGGGGTPSLPVLSAPVISVASIDADTLRVNIGAVANEVSFDIERSNDGSTGWTLVQNVAANTAQYDDNLLPASTTRFYRVRAKANPATHQDSPYSNIASGTTGAAAPSFEPETTAYMGAIGIANNSTIYFAGTPHESTGAELWIAINNLVASGKTSGYFSKLRRVFPFIGGNAAGNAFDLISASSRIAWTGSVLHGGYGAEANVVTPPSTGTGFGIIDLNMNSLPANNYSMHFYRTDNADHGNQWVMGASDDTADNYFIMQQRNAGLARAAMGSIASMISGSNTDSRGFWSATRTSNSVAKYIRNGSSVIATDSTTNAKPNINLNFGLFIRNETGSPTQQCPAICGFAAIGEGMTDSEVLNFYNHVQDFATALGRNV